MPEYISDLDHEGAVEAMVQWFWVNFEDPAHETPWDEGEYVFIWGGPYDAREELVDAFGSVASEHAIDEAVSKIEQEGWQWAPSASRIQPESPENEPGTDRLDDIR